MSDCRQDSCCNNGYDGLTGASVVPPNRETGEGTDGGVPPPNCVPPVVTLTVDKRAIRCGEKFTLTYHTQDAVSVSISPAVGGTLTPNTTGTIETTVTVATTFTLTAVGNCTSASSSVQVIVTDSEVYVWLDVETICDGSYNPGDVTLFASSSNLPAGQMTITADPPLLGFPIVVDNNDSYEEVLQALPVADTTFTITAITACGTWTDDVTLYVTRRVNAPYLNAIQQACNIYLEWGGETCYGSQAMTIQGPSFGYCDAYIPVVWPASKTINPNDYASCFLKNPEGCWYGVWDWALTTVGGESYSGQSMAYAYPYLTSFTCSQTNPVTCRDGAASVTLNWSGYFLGNGIRIYDDLGNYVTGEAGSNDYFHTGSAIVQITRNTTFYLYGLETCGPACNGPLTLTVTVTGCECGACNDSNMSAYFPIVRLQESVYDIAQNILDSKDYLGWGDCSSDGCAGVQDWDGTINYLGQPLGGGRCSYEAPYVAGDGTTCIIWREENPLIAGCNGWTVAVTITSDYDANGCWWLLEVGHHANGGQCGTVITYRHDGVNPVGTYTAVGETYELPTTLHIELPPVT